VSNNVSDSFVYAVVELTNQTCTYTVENPKIPKNTNNEEKSGIGLQNVRRRLELSYPNQHELIIEDTPTHYRVHLTLNLA
jgi:LytS/YehU family sensor histidine kinase